MFQIDIVEQCKHNNSKAQKERGKAIALKQWALEIGNNNKTSGKSIIINS